MRPERLDIRVPRNADYNETWEIHDIDDVPIDLTDCTLQMKIRRAAGNGTNLATASISITDAVNGLINIRITGASLAMVEGQNESVKLAYDLRLTYPDNVKFILSEGNVILTPGVTY